MTEPIHERQNPIPTQDGRRNALRYKVPVFPHVKKFLRKNYRPQNGAIKVEEYTILGKYVTLALLDRRTQYHLSQYRDRLTKVIIIELTSEQAHKMSPRLSKLLRINIDIDRLFKEHLVAWITSLRVAGIPPYNSCRMFLDYYSIDENEYSLKSAYQYWQRYKKKEDCEEKDGAD